MKVYCATINGSFFSFIHPKSPKDIDFWLAVKRAKQCKSLIDSLDVLRNLSYLQITTIHFDTEKDYNDTVTIEGDEDGIISIIDHTTGSEHIEIDELDDASIYWLYGEINKEKEHKTSRVWSDMHPDEPSETLYAYWDGDRYVQIRSDTDELVEQLRKGRKMYRISLDFPI